QSDRPYVTSRYPLRATEAGLAATFISFGETKNLGSFVKLDLGPTPQAVDLRLVCSAQGVRNIVVGYPDGTGNYAALRIDADSNDEIHYVPGAPIHVVPLPAMSGEVIITVSVGVEPGFIYADWTISAPGSVDVLSVYGVKGTGGSKEDESGACST